MSLQLLITLVIQICLCSTLVHFPTRLFVKPGDDFDLTCKIDFEGVIDKIYDPNEYIPSGRELEAESQLIPSHRFQEEDARVESVQYTGATVKEHQGYYTCVTYRQTGFPRVETATCYVIVGDPCESVVCPPLETCVADMETFTHECEAIDPTSAPPKLPGSSAVCTVFPGGVIESFDSAATYYDLACTHMLAADILPDGDFRQAWYIYGTFDQHEGNTALFSVTIFAGTTAFEFQRGWLINNNGGKFEVEEGVPRKFGDCEITFTGLHLVAECPHFNAYYDGVMSGHIRLRNSQTQNSIENVQKSVTDAGLCWDSHSGFRPNWQISSPTWCFVDPKQEPCQISEKCDNFKKKTITDLGDKEASSGQGVFTSCGQLHCEDKLLTSTQQCALNQADAANLLLRKNAELTGRIEVEGCPEEECDWKLDLLSRGCPQENPPFQC